MYYLQIFHTAKVGLPLAYPPKFEFIEGKIFVMFCLDGVGHCVKFLLEATGALSSAR